MWRLADGEDGGDQVIQRPGQVVLSGQDNLVIDAKMVDRPSRNRVVGRWGCQGACGQVLLRADVAGRGGVNHPAPHGAVLADSGHDDPHQLSLSPLTAFHQVDGDDRGLPGCPASYRSSSWIRWQPQPGSSRAISSISTAIWASTRGRPPL
jgi:hypothetical protein